MFVWTLKAENQAVEKGDYDRKAGMMAMIYERPLESNTINNWIYSGHIEYKDEGELFYSKDDLRYGYFTELVKIENKQKGKNLFMEDFVRIADYFKEADYISVNNHEELVKYFIQNDMINDFIDLPQKYVQFLDYQKIGKEIINITCGKFLSKGYVFIKELVSDIKILPSDQTTELDMEDGQSALEMKM